MCTVTCKVLYTLQSTVHVHGTRNKSRHLSACVATEEARVVVVEAQAAHGAVLVAHCGAPEDVPESLDARVCMWKSREKSNGALLQLKSTAIPRTLLVQTKCTITDTCSSSEPNTSTRPCEVPTAMLLGPTS